MITRETEFMTYFEEKIALCSQKERELIADAREDEANFEKIRANVYDIFRTVYTAGKRAKKDDTLVKEFFLARMEQIPQNWVTALEKAKQHNDVRAVQIETIKCNTADEIKAVFKKLWEE